jgi:hypothetical protein
MIFLIKLFFFIVISFSNVKAEETSNNKILFKINEKVFTKIDLEKRIEYIQINNNIDKKKTSDSDKETIFNDFVSSLIFYEYYINTNIKLKGINEDINSLFKKNILQKESVANLRNEEIENLKNNFGIDIIRRKIIESILNSRKNKLTKKADLSDLIYNYNLSHLTIKEEDIIYNYIKEIKNRDDFNVFKSKLIESNIDFLYKNEDINESSIISNLLKRLIKNNKKIYYESKNGYIILISLEKDLESYEGVFVKLINFNITKPIDNKDLNCSNINKLTDIKKTFFKEYEYKKLNKEIKKNLKSIDDYIIYKDNNNYNYVFLCELRYDESLLNNINFNKKVESLANKIQINFLNKYKKEYDYQKIE